MLVYPPPQLTTALCPRQSGSQLLASAWRGEGPVATWDVPACFPQTGATFGVAARYSTRTAASYVEQKRARPASQSGRKPGSKQGSQRCSPGLAQVCFRHARSPRRCRLKAVSARNPAKERRNPGGGPSPHGRVDGLDGGAGRAERLLASAQMTREERRRGGGRGMSRADETEDEANVSATSDVGSPRGSAPPVDPGGLQRDRGEECERKSQ